MNLKVERTETTTTNEPFSLLTLFKDWEERIVAFTGKNYIFGALLSNKITHARATKQ